MKFRLRSVVCVYAGVYIIMAQIVLPAYGLKDFFIISSWSIFSFPPETIVFDYSWDNQKTFLFRDYQNELKSRLNRNYRRLFFKRSMRGRPEIILASDKELLLKLSGNQAISMYRIEGTLKQHILDKKALAATEVFQVQK